MLERRPSVKVCATAKLSRKECEKAAGVIEAACPKVFKKETVSGGRLLVTRFTQ